MKYTPKGSKVKVSIKGEENVTQITVKDKAIIALYSLPA